MPNIKPISIDTEKNQALLQLFRELSKGKNSGEEKGWISLEVVEEKVAMCDSDKKITEILI